MEVLKYYRNKVAFSKTLPPVQAKYGSYNFNNSKINRFLAEKGIRLYSHQSSGISLALSGKNLVLTTPTASGKSFVYILSLLEKLYQNPDARALLIFPLKALARDQYGKISEVISETGIEATVKVYDGDTDRERRQSIKRNPPNFLITTPDMLNAGILPYHSGWSSFFEDLEFIVLDEIHAYRGIIGSHISNIVRRLKRIVSFYRTRKPVFIMNSATIHNPFRFCLKN
ncbi:MAG: DEAD/DEAH box helicase [Persephonella sp.]|nr:DEAD/DEAH box helicase [Persephonella sp.]